MPLIKTVLTSDTVHRPEMKELAHVDETPMDVAQLQAQGMHEQEMEMPVYEEIAGTPAGYDTPEHGTPTELAGQDEHGMPAGQAGFGMPAGQAGLGTPAGQAGLGMPAGQAGLGTPAGQAGHGTPAGQAGLGMPAGQAGLGTPAGQAGHGTPAGQAGHGTPAGQAGFGTPAGQAGFGMSAGQAGLGMPAGQAGQAGLPEPAKSQPAECGPVYINTSFSPPKLHQTSAKEKAPPLPPKPTGISTILPALHILPLTYALILYQQVQVQL